MYSRPVPPLVAQAAQNACAEFALKCQQDPQFNAFIGANDNRITRFYAACTTLIGSLADPGTAEREELAKKMFNGPVQVVFSRPSTGLIVHMSNVDRPPLSDQEFRNTLRDWSVRTVTYVQRYMMTTPLNDISALLDAGEDVEVTITPATDRNAMGVVLQADAFVATA